MIDLGNIAGLHAHNHELRTHCPRRTAPLTQQRIGGVDTDVCEHCGGVWLNAGELAQIRR